MNADRISENRYLIGLSSLREDVEPRDLWHAEISLNEALGKRDQVTIIAHARGEDRDARSQRFADVLTNRFGVKAVRFLHQEKPADVRNVLKDSSGIVAIGGNTYRLVANVHALRHADGTLVDNTQGAIEEPITEILRESVADGMPFIGHSAGLHLMFKDVIGANDPMEEWAQRQIDGSSTVNIEGLGLMPDHLRAMPHFGDPGIADIAKKIARDGRGLIVLGVNNLSFVVVKGDKMTVGEGMNGIGIDVVMPGRKLQYKPYQDISYLLK